MNARVIDLADYSQRRDTGEAEPYSGTGAIAYDRAFQVVMEKMGDVTYREIDVRVSEDTDSDNIFQRFRSLAMSSGIQAESRRVFSLLPPRKARIDELYPDVSAAGSPRLHTALNLISTAVIHLRNAEQAMDKGDVLEADDEVQHLHMQLTEMFCLREIGEGYATLINAMRLALNNRAGLPLDRDQLCTLRAIMERLQVEPFIRLHQTFELLELLEDKGFEIDPPALKHLADQYEDGDR